ncbi:MAG TPA: polyprenyl synthetase family protein, partial [Microbacterium sp.]|nr:polyprenyl synthetase family protein [Microbacterium sp.]
MVPSTLVSDAVAARLESFLIRMQADTADYGPDAALFLDAARTTLLGGKRLRARFCHGGWQAAAPAPHTDADPLWGLCAALEIFQSAALVHDDLIDNSDTRRGRPASHR